MEKVEVIKSTDYRSIDKITPKYPSLMNNNAEEIIREEYNNLIKAADKLMEARNKVRELEDYCSKLRDAFNSKSSLFEITFKSKEKTRVIHDSNISLQGLGNDIIGRTSAL